MKSFRTSEKMAKRFDPFAVAVCNGDIVIGTFQERFHPFVRYIFVEVARSTAV